MLTEVGLATKPQGQSFGAKIGVMDLGQMISRVKFGHAVSRVREDIECAMNLGLLDAIPSLKGFGKRRALALVGTGAFCVCV